jgi:outer membrane protein OmpA-like peptidoglycan-associated protein
MLKTSALAVCLLAATALGACTTIDPYSGETVRNNTGTGVIAGALGGALLGYLTNTSDGEQGRKNALLGAGIGALGGAAVGNYMDRQQAELRAELAGTGVSVTRQGDDLILNMPSDVTFGVDQADIQPQFYRVLDGVGTILNRYPQTLVDVTGHADSTGDDQYNQSLSERRASSVAAYLISNSRLLRDRFYVTGRGETQPIASNPTVEGRSQNRRVEIVLRPFLG